MADFADFADLTGFGAEDAGDLAASVGVVIGVDKVIEYSRNELKYSNFAVQCRDAKILTLRKHCKASKSKNSIQNRIETYDAYADLYILLLIKKVITLDIKPQSIVTLDFVNTINKSEIETDRLKQLVNENDPAYPVKLRCYTVDHKKLSEFFKKYEHRAFDEARLYRRVIKGDTNNTKTSKTPGKTKKSYPSIRPTTPSSSSSKKPRSTPKTLSRKSRTPPK
jgi:hypothetical protein